MRKNQRDKVMLMKVLEKMMKKQMVKILKIIKINQYQKRRSRRNVLIIKRKSPQHRISHLKLKMRAMKRRQVLQKKMRRVRRRKVKTNRASYSQKYKQNQSRPYSLGPNAINSLSSRPNSMTK